MVNVLLVPFTPYNEWAYKISFVTFTSIESSIGGDRSSWVQILCYSTTMDVSEVVDVAGWKEAEM
jgi:hypothetical protein